MDLRIIGLVALAHGISHFFQISTAVLFPLIKGDLGVSYAALGATVALYYVVSGVCQTLAGFAADRFGARRVLFAGLTLATAGALLAGLAHSYEMLVAAAVVGGLGNSVFHPCDFSILNARVARQHIGHAFSWHGIAGFLGYAAAPAFAFAMAEAVGWRGALLGAALLGGSLAADLGVLASAPVLMCFGYFVLAAVGFIALQSFGIATMMSLYGASAALASAALTAYLLGASVGIFAGGFAATRWQRHDLIAVAGVAVSSLLIFVLASAWLPAALLPPLLAVTGFAGGLTGPSRDLIVRATTPPGSTGKVYGFVYSGLDVGSIATPVYFGWLLDGGRPSLVFFTVVVSSALMIATVLNLPGNRRLARA